MVFQASLTITVMFLMMIYYSVWMTILVCLFSVLMLTVTKKFGGASSRYMMEQQKSLAKEEGFIEEMIQGQKVVKVFCHEEECKKDFDKLNEKLFSDGELANRYGNSLMPILNNVGNLMYVVLAIVGGLLVYCGAPNLSLGGNGVLTIGIIGLVPRNGKTAFPDDWAGIHAGFHGRNGTRRSFQSVLSDR